MKKTQKIIPTYNEIGCMFHPSATLENVYQRKNYLLNTQTHHMYVDLTYKICPSCGLVFSSPQISAETWAEYLQNEVFTVMSGQVDLDYYEASLSPLVKNFLDSIDGQGLSLLEVGSGDGHLLYYLAQKYDFKVKGIDLSRLYCDYGQEKLGLDVENISLEKCSQDSTRFDLIISVHVFEHMCSPLEAFDEVHNLLNDDGFFIVIVPSVHFPLFSIRDMFSAHNFLFSSETIRQAIFSSGFEIVGSAEEGCSIIHILKKTKLKRTASLNAYEDIRLSLDASLTTYNRVNAKVAARIESHVKLWAENKRKTAIWGAGEHTASVLSDFDFSACNIKYIIDSNSYLWGKELLGYPIVAPETIKDDDIDEILISSYGYENEIHGQIVALNPSVKPLKLYY